MNRFALLMMIGFVALIGFSVTFVTFQKCGWKTFLYGKSASLVAISGLCED